MLLARGHKTQGNNGKEEEAGEEQGNKENKREKNRTNDYVMACGVQRKDWKNLVDGSRLSCHRPQAAKHGKARTTPRLVTWGLPSRKRKKWCAVGYHVGIGCL